MQAIQSSINQTLYQFASNFIDVIFPPTSNSSVSVEVRWWIYTQTNISNKNIAVPPG